MSCGATPASARTVLVIGDVIVDHHLHVGSEGGQTSAGRVREHVEPAGAAMLAQLIERTGSAGRVDRGFELDVDRHRHRWMLWEPHPDPRADSPKDRVWRCTRQLGISDPMASGPNAEGATTCRVEAIPQGDVDSKGGHDIVVVDGAGPGLHDRFAPTPAVFVGTAAHPPWCVVKLSGRVNGGGVGDRISADEALSARTIVILSAGQLRDEGHEISEGLTFERTTSDVARTLLGLRKGLLAHARFVIVTYADTGALCCDFVDRASPRMVLVFDPRAADADTADGLPAGIHRGRRSCLAAGVVCALCEEASGEDEFGAVVNGVRRGLAARLELHDFGHGPVDETQPAPGFPIDRIVEHALGKEASRPRSLEQIDIDAHRALGDEGSWSILTYGSGGPWPVFEIALRIAQEGLSVVRRAPVLRVGDFVTVDPSEIESIRRIRRRVLEYERGGTQRRPLCLAVFGAPGSGKSFIVGELAKGVLGTDVTMITANLSQVTDEKELTGTFHRVRDAVLRGHTPVVFWDEFDSEDYRWLRLLLAPMQDGVFQEGQVVHPIGKCVFVFAGGTCHRFADFGRFQSDDAESARKRDVWRMRKGPDFSSRLHGHLDILGPNPTDSAAREDGQGAQVADLDVSFPIRRALFIRSILRLGENNECELSSGVLDALLMVPRYVHGSRSFERLLTAVKRHWSAGSAEALPDREDLQRDVEGEIDGKDAADWMPWFVRREEQERVVGRHLRRWIDQRIDDFAARIHASYMERPSTERSIDVGADFAALSLFLQESNRAAARRAWRVLAATGLELVETTHTGALTREAALQSVRADDVAAIEEHRGWREFHVRRGWRHARIDRKDEVRRLHPALVEWSELPEKSKSIARDQCAAYVQIVYECGLALAKT